MAALQAFSSETNKVVGVRYNLILHDFSNQDQFYGGNFLATPIEVSTKFQND